MIGHKGLTARKRMLLWLAAIVVTGTILNIATSGWAATPGEGEIRSTGAAQAVPDSYIVVLKESAAIRAQGVDSTASALSTRFGGKVKHSYKTALRGFSVTQMSEAQAKRLAADPAVAYVQRDVKVRKTEVQQNPTWNLARLSSGGPGGRGAYVYPGLASDVHAYVIDSGIRLSHIEFESRASYGYNFVDMNDVASDCNGHGTHVAGLLGGVRYGVAKGVQIVAVKVLDCTGEGTAAGVAAGVDWVTANAVKPAVANLSLGAPGDIPVINDAVRAAIASGITVTVSAGNGDDAGNPLDACGQSPASVNQALTVAAIDNDDRRPRWSNYGPCVDVFAPGVAIVSSVHIADGAYRELSGTSMAAPHVAGAAAFILQAHPAYTPEQVRGALLRDAWGNDVIDAMEGTPNLLLYVRSQEPPTIGSDTVSVHNASLGRTDVFARTSDNHLVQTHYSPQAGQWSQWLDLGGDIAGNPAALYNPRFGTTEVYARTNDNRLVYAYFSNWWWAWMELGTDIAGDPAVLYNPRFGTTEVYVRTADNRLAYRYFSNGWSDWIDLQGNLASNPALLHNPRFGTTEAYVRTADNEIHYRYFSNGWSSWIDLEGSTAGDPAVLYNPRFGTTEVYTRTVDNRLAYRYYSNGWSSWNDLHGDVAGDPALLYNPRFGTTEAYVRTSSNQLQYRYYSNGWSAWINLDGNVTGTPSLIFNPEFGTTEVYTTDQASDSGYRYFANGWSGWLYLTL